MKNLEESKKTKQRHFAGTRHGLLLGAGLIYLRHQVQPSFLISFLLVDFPCALKIANPHTSLPTAIKEGPNREMVVKDVDVLENIWKWILSVWIKRVPSRRSYPFVERFFLSEIILRKIF